MYVFTDTMGGLHLMNKLFLVLVPKFPVTNKTAFTGISEKQDNLARYTQFLELSDREFALHFILIFLPEFPIEWFVFQKFNNFRIISKLSQEISVPVVAVSKFRNL